MIRASWKTVVISFDTTQLLKLIFVLINQRSKCTFKYHDPEASLSLSTDDVGCEHREFYKESWELNRWLYSRHNHEDTQRFSLRIDQLSILVIILKQKFTVHLILETHLSCIHFKPIVSFTEIIKNDSATVMTSGAQNNAWWWVSLRSYPSAVEHVSDEHERHQNDESNCNLIFYSFLLLIIFLYSLWILSWLFRCIRSYNWRCVNVLDVFRKQMRYCDSW